MNALSEPLGSLELFLFDAKIIPKNRYIGAGARIDLYGLRQVVQLRLSRLQVAFLDLFPNRFQGPMVLGVGHPARINEAQLFLSRCRRFLRRQFIGLVTDAVRPIDRGVMMIDG